MALTEGLKGTKSLKLILICTPDIAAFLVNFAFQSYLDIYWLKYAKSAQRQAAPAKSAADFGHMR